MKIKFTFKQAESSEELSANTARTRTLGLPEIHGGIARRPRLMVLGGDPYIEDRLEEIKSWDGDVWAINGAFQWARRHGINATFFTIDAAAVVATLLDGVERAVIASFCHPSVFDRLMSQGAEVHTFDTGSGHGEIGHSATSATASPHAAVICGYSQVVYYGCASNYRDGRSHTYKQDNFPLVEIRAGGETYRTNAAFFGQAEFLAAAIRAAPHVFSERSGGLLGALVADPDYDITAVSREIYDNLTWEKAA